MARAVQRAVSGVDAGLVVHDVNSAWLKAAVVLAPETALEDSMAMVFAAALGFSDALGALAPPEVAVHLTWPDGIRVNGARCGRLLAASSTEDREAVPDWLVLGLDVPIKFSGKEEPGLTPDETSLIMEGCGEIDPFNLLESWSRHMLVWINTWETAGMSRLHTEWRGKAFDMGEEVTVRHEGQMLTGTFTGLDEKGGLLLRTSNDTRILPLSSMLATS